MRSNTESTFFRRIEFHDELITHFHKISPVHIDEISKHSFQGEGRATNLKAILHKQKN
jgi:hypothetical protein